MKKALNWIRLDFLPRSPDLAILVLRLWLGGVMVWNHGWSKLAGFNEQSSGFADPLGIGSAPSLALVVFAEVVCAALLALGFLTRFAALVSAVNMSVAFFIVHKMTLQPGPGSGELAFIYLGGFLAVLISGAGKFSIDAKVFSKP